MPESELINGKIVPFFKPPYDMFYAITILTDLITWWNQPQKAPNLLSIAEPPHVSYLC